MWLLTTDRAELVLFQQPPKEYAILSHVWRKEEQSFQDVQAIIRRCNASPHDRNPRDHVDDKIRKCCQWAQAHGFKLVWIDTCCIDKSSSAELSEAINSMFLWYSNATICYAYLHDATDDEDPADIGSSFRKSRWFSRGWTLQELIAPRDVVFLSRNWQPLASKITVARLLEQITGIDAHVLRGRRSLDEVSVARRMSWASSRQTTRIEDEAYCLMGIFGVNLPTIYGEGTEAFIRLQEEIIKRTPDLTLLAWGPRRPLVETVVGYRSSIFPTTLGEAYISQSCLLARSPKEFTQNAASTTAVPAEVLAGSFGIRTEISHLTVSSYGAQIMLPVVRFSNHCTLAILPCKEQDAFIALLLRFQGSSGPWSIGTQTIVSETTHLGRWRPEDQDILTSTQEHPVRCVLVRNQHEFELCMQRPLREQETIPSPSWDRLFIAYRTQQVLVRAQTHQPKLWARSPFFSPCKLIVPAWALKRLERSGYSLVSPLPTSFLALNPGQLLSLAFLTPDVSEHRSPFALHIGSDSVSLPPGSNSAGKRSPLWCIAHFPPPEVRNSSRPGALGQWLAREMASGPTPAQRLLVRVHAYDHFRPHRPLA